MFVWKKEVWDQRLMRSRQCSAVKIKWVLQHSWQIKVFIQLSSSDLRWPLTSVMGHQWFSLFPLHLLWRASNMSALWRFPWRAAGLISIQTNSLFYKNREHRTKAEQVNKQSDVWTCEWRWKVCTPEGETGGNVNTLKSQKNVSELFEETVKQLVGCAPD